ncbi:MAG: leucine-rich repeat protein [Clostridia bacterium]|nr:leucine-rich repeat protein [Clostridia bacterium]
MKKAFVVCLIIFVLLLAGCTEAYKLEFSAEETSVIVGDVFTPEVVVRPGRFDYELYSSNNTILTVKGKEVEALKAGVATLTAQSGEKTASMTVYVLTEGSARIDDPNFPDAAYVYFSVINYATAQLENPIIHSLAMTAGTDITGAFPILTGYKLAWYADEEMKNPIDGRVVCKKGQTMYYAYAQAEYNNVLTKDGLVTGLTYPNLDHSTYAFPDSYNGVPITGIADYAFYGDTTLETIVIPRTYTYIGKFAFAGCTKLKSVRFAEGSLLTEIGDFAFGPTYTEPKEEVKEEDEEESSEVLAYLDALLDSVGLTQLVGGTDTQKTEEPEITINSDYCAALVDITLPASVKKIGSYAFYNSSMASVLPEDLEEIDYGAFRGSKITSADLKNVKKIGAYAFYDCKELATVTNAGGVQECGGYAFAGTKLYNDQIADKGAVYADKILIGNYNGNDRVNIRYGTTLIADYAFNNKKMETLTVLFNAGEHVTIGWQAFYVTGYATESTNHPLFSENVFLAVAENEAAAYKSENPLLSDRICERMTIIVSGKDNVNFGLHSIFKMDARRYVYDKFISGTEDGMIYSPKEIDLTSGPLAGYEIVRINSYAFESVGRLEKLRMPADLEEVADCAVSDCKKLSLIDYSSTRSVPTLLSNNAMQFSELNGDCIVLVGKANYEAFRNKWAERATAKGKLRYKQNVELYKDGIRFKTAEYCLPYAGLPQEEGIETWYTDAGCNVECQSIGESTELYAKTH